MKTKHVKFLRLMLIGFLSVMLSACGVSEGASPQAVPPSEELNVSAAASLQAVLTELGEAYEQKNPEVKITFNFASSGTLQRQIEQGALVDLFISAGKKQMDELEKKNLLLQGTRLDLLSNELVLITGKENNEITELQDLTKPMVSKIGIGTPETSPAGQYAKEALVNLQMWDLLQEKYVQAKDVKQVLTYVETGNIEAGFVYYSDTIDSDKIKIVMSLPVDSHAPIVYPASLVLGTENIEKAEVFLQYLQGEAAQKIFEQYGFSTTIKG